MDQLGLKDSSHDFQLNCVISYFFLPTFNTPYKRLKIDVMEREWKNLKLWGKLNKALSSTTPSSVVLVQAAPAEAERYTRALFSC
jgi:hypothetical protein